MGNPLRDRHTAAEWAAAGQVIEIAEKLKGFEQLAAIVRADITALDADKRPADWRDSVVAGRLEFGFADAQGRIPVVRCSVAVTVDAVCQRCLEAFRLPLAAEANLLLLALDEATEEHEDHEVWELDEETLRPLDIVQELLIMAMPFSVMHVDSASCKALSAATDNRKKMTKPFAALRAQMLQD